jgi:hypothetical protein
VRDSSEVQPGAHRRFRLLAPICGTLAVAVLAHSTMVVAGPSARAPRGIDLSGHWQVNEAESENLEAKMAAALEKRRGAGTSGFPPPMNFGAGGSRPPMLPGVAARATELKIEQSNNRLVVETNSSKHDFTPGEKFSISTDTGSAERRTGWDGKNYRIETRINRMVSFAETWTLSKGGQRLEVLCEVRGPASVRAKRIFERVSASADANAPNTSSGR